MNKLDAQRDLIVFHAVWDERIGPIITDKISRDNSIDLEEITLQIFQSFQLVFGNAADVSFDKTNFFLPLKSVHKVAKIFLDSIENQEVRGGRQPYAIIILLPEEFVTDNLPAFDDLLQNMSTYYANERNIDLSSYFDEIIDVYLGQQFQEDLNIEIEKGYSFNAAVNDFKRGLEFFQKKNYNSAYLLIKKASIKFEKEEQVSLVSETQFLMGTILAQRGRYAAALDYYKKLIETSKENQRDKYLEQGIFMAGFCYHKMNMDGEALEYLQEIDVQTIKKIQPLKYLLVLARIYQNLKMHVKSARTYRDALGIVLDMPEDESNLTTKAQIYYSLGVDYFRIALASLRALGMNHLDAVEEHLTKAIKALNSSTEFLKKTGDYRSLISTYKLIAQIYGFKNQKKEQIRYLYEANQTAIESNDIIAQVRIIDLIIRIHESLNQYNEIIDLIDDVFGSISTNTFIDMYSVAKLHQKKGEAFLNLGSEKEALDEFLITLNTYKKIEAPLVNQQRTLETILEIHENRQEQDRIDYYTKLLRQIGEEIQGRSIAIEKTDRPFGPVRELWVMSEIGPELYNYAPDTEVDTDLLGGFMTAMQSFSMEMQHEQLNSLTIGRDRYDLINEEGVPFFVLGRSSVKTPENITKRILRKVSRLFHDEYSEHLQDFNGDCTPFSSFASIVEKTDFSYL